MVQVLIELLRYGNGNGYGNGRHGHGRVQPLGRSRFRLHRHERVHHGRLLGRMEPRSSRYDAQTKHRKSLHAVRFQHVRSTIGPIILLRLQGPLPVHGSLSPHELPGCLERSHAVRLQRQRKGEPHGAVHAVQEDSRN